MLKLVLLTVATWSAVSILLTSLWGIVIARATDPAGYADPGAARGITKTPPDGGGANHSVESSGARAMRALGVQDSSQLTQRASAG
jgi:hypothetical protein